MKIVIAVGSLEQGGAERVIANLSKDLAQKGHSVEILLYYDRKIGYEIDERVKVTADEAHIGKASIIKHMRFRRSYVKKSGADVFVSFLAPFNMLNIVTLFGLKIPLVVADRNDPRKIPKNPIIRWARNFLYLFADGVVLQNKRNEEYFSRAIRKKSKIIYNSMDLGEYEKIARDTPKEKKIVCVGRLVAQKRPKMLIDAFSMVTDEFPEYRLVFCGDGNMREELLACCEELGLSKKVEFLGALTNVFECTKNAELFVLCSDFEGMPNALLEAMCMGLCVISTKVSGATDVIKDGENGLLVDCGDALGLASAMRKMLADDDFRNKCADNASKLSDVLQKDKITDEWISYIKSICDEKRKK